MLADIMKSCLAVEPNLGEGATEAEDDLLGVLNKFVVGGRGQDGVLPKLSAQTREQLAQWDDIGPIYSPGYYHYQMYAQLKRSRFGRHMKTAAARAANTQEESEAKEWAQTQTQDEEELTQQPLPYLSSSQPSIFIPPPVSSQPAFSLAPSSQQASLPRSSQRGPRRKRRRVNEGF